MCVWCHLADDGQNIVFRQDKVVFPVQFDFRAAVLGNKHAVSGLHGKFNQGAFFIAAAYIFSADFLSAFFT